MWPNFRWNSPTRTQNNDKKGTVYGPIFPGLKLDLIIRNTDSRANEYFGPILTHWAHDLRLRSTGLTTVTPRVS